MGLNNQQRAILKHPGYVGNKLDMVRQYGIMKNPKLHEITFTKVAHTEVTCTYCKGAGVHYEDMGLTFPGVINSPLVASKCPSCNGTKKMMIDNREVKGYGI